MLKMRRHDRKIPENVRIVADGIVIYHGKWNDLPIGEETMLRKSREFFDDPEPCYIHRAGVRLKLLTEIGELLMRTDAGSHKEAIRQLRDCMECSEITGVECSGSSLHAGG